MFRLGIWWSFPKSPLPLIFSQSIKPAPSWFDLLYFTSCDESVPTQAAQGQGPHTQRKNSVPHRQNADTRLPHAHYYPLVSNSNIVGAITLLTTALRGLRSGQPSVGICVVRVRVLPGVQRTASRSRCTHQVNWRTGHRIYNRNTLWRRRPAGCNRAGDTMMVAFIDVVRYCWKCFAIS